MNIKLRKDENACCGSYHGHNFYASVEELVALFGEQCYKSDLDFEKIQNEWDFFAEDLDNYNYGVFGFTIYDYKEYRLYSETEVINWHIGAETEQNAAIAYAEVVRRLNLLRRA